jgi:hypothetical protein
MEVKHMRKLLCLLFITLVGYGVIPHIVQAATQRVAIQLSGRYCFFHTYDVAEALKRVHGVLGVDLESVQHQVIVIMDAGKVNPDHLLAAIRGIKGEGYQCKGRFESEPGKVEY